MAKRNNKMMLAGGAALLVLVLVIVWVASRFMNGTKPGPGNNTGEKPFVTMADMAAVPAQVREAAQKLKTSKVGYPMVVGGKTYLVISTGNDAVRVSLDRSVVAGAAANPNMVDVFLKTDGAGQSLLIATTPLATLTEYQFNLNDSIAAIPTLHNPHNLPLVALDAVNRFSLVTPEVGAMTGDGVLHVAGYAQVFEAQFSVTIMTAKGRTLGVAPVHAAVGAPGWGSFVADVKFDTTNLPETGFAVFEEGQGGAKLIVPVRFRNPGQLG